MIDKGMATVGSMKLFITYIVGRWNIFTNNGWEAKLIMVVCVKMKFTRRLY